IGFQFGFQPEEQPNPDDRTNSCDWNLRFARDGRYKADHGCEESQSRQRLRGHMFLRFIAEHVGGFDVPARHELPTAEGMDFLPLARYSHEREKECEDRSSK